PPKGKSNATHFQLLAAISTASAHKWHRKTQKYRATHPRSNSLGATVTTETLSCNKVYPNLQLVLSNPLKSNPFRFSKFTLFKRNSPNPIAITVWLGITFGNMEGNTY